MESLYAKRVLQNVEVVQNLQHVPKQKIERVQDVRDQRIKIQIHIQVLDAKRVLQNVEVVQNL